MFNQLKPIKVKNIYYIVMFDIIFGLTLTVISYQNGRNVVTSIDNKKCPECAGYSEIHYFAWYDVDLWPAMAKILPRINYDCRVYGTHNYIKITS